MVQRVKARKAGWSFVPIAVLAVVLLVAVSSAWATVSEIPGRPDDGQDFPGAKSTRSASVQEEVEASRIPGHYIVVLKGSVEHPGAVAEAQTDRFDGEVELVYRFALKGYSAELPKDAVAALRNTPNVKYVEPARRGTAFSQTTPTGLSRIHAPENPATDIDETDDARVNVDVAVIDTGVDYTHPDLNVVARTDCVPANEGETGAESCVDNSGVVVQGHGTHVAGTIGAIDNGYGVVGVAPGARIWSVQVMRNAGFWSPWLVAGIDWVAAHASEIEVANMSLGGTGTVLAVNEAIANATQKGVVFAVAAMNEQRNAANVFPANSPDVITVSALADSDGKAGGEGEPCRGADDTLAEFSNWGAGVELAAPGTCIYSTWPGGGYEYLSGTSMASPHVAGAAAVLAAKSNPNSMKDVEAIRQTLVEGGSLDWDDTSEDGEPEPVLYLGSEALKSPEISTGGWSSMDASGSATVSGAINPRGQKAEYKFEYGLTTSYGTSTPVEVKEGKYATVSRKIEGLTLGKTYHYRLTATTPSGTIYGKDKTLNPSLWSKQALNGQPASDYEELDDVSCPTATMCMAVGYRYAKESPWYFPISYKLSEGKWSYVSMPIPAGGGFTIINSVSCTSASACIAVGKVQMEGGVVVPLAESWDGSKWTLQSITAPPTEATTPYARLEDVSCASSTECMATGYFKAANVDPEYPEEALWQSYTAQWKGGKWTNSYPLSSAEGFMEDVSCTSASFCAVAGTQKEMTWNGSSWTSYPAENSYYGVSCITAPLCLAVAPAWSLDVWNGTKWTETPRNENARSSSLYDVSCVSPSYCLASGFQYWPTSAAVEVWDGSNMTPQATLRGSEERAYFWGSDCYIYSCVAVGKTVGETEKALIATIPDRRPTATTEAANLVSSSKATLRGMVNPNGVTTTYRFEYGPTTAYGTSVPVTAKEVGSGKGLVEVKEALTGLTPEGTYHYRVVAESEGGTSRGEDKTFTLPYAITEPATDIYSPGATLNGKVDPAGLETSYQFEYGTTTSYGSKAPASPKAIGSGTEYVSVSEVLEGLKAATTYHYRVVGTNSKGTYPGKDATFTTKAASSVNWYRCTKGPEGQNVYEDAACSKTGGSKKYLWWKLSTSPFVAKSTTKYLLGYTYLGIPIEFECSATHNGGSISNGETADMSGYGLTLSECAVVKPTGKGCQIQGNEISIPSLKGHSTAGSTEPEIRLEASQGSVMALFTLKSCSTTSLNRLYEITGTLPMKMENSSSTFYTNSSISLGKLKVNGQSAWAASSSKIETNSGEVVKLAP